MHRLRHADAVREGRRHADRRLPGHHPDDRRVGSDLPVHDRHAARSRARPGRATTASSRPTCTPTRSRTAGSDAIVASALARRSGHFGEAAADVARRPQRFVLRQHLLEWHDAGIYRRGRRRGQRTRRHDSGVNRNQYAAWPYPIGSPRPVPRRDDQGVAYAIFSAAPARTWPTTASTPPRPSSRGLPPRLRQRRRQSPGRRTKRPTHELTTGRRLPP